MAELLRGYPGVPILAAGDIAYTNGTTQEFATCFDPRWGFLKDRIRPAPGNHEYGIYPKDGAPARNNAEPYFAYFGASAGPDEKGFYSFDLGTWHVVSLNSMAGVTARNQEVPVKAPSMAEQIRWLEEDLRGTDKGCILAFWHHPLFSSGEHGDDKKDPGRKVDGLWKVLASHGADVIVNGHDHNFEVFGPQTVEGVADSAHGIRQFVVGTGGGEVRELERPFKPNHEYGEAGVSTLGVLLLQLHAGSYEWKFAKVDGTTPYASRAPEVCHPKGSR